MANVPDIGFEHRVARFSELVGLGVTAAAGVVLLAWALDIPWLTSLLPGLVTMKSNTAMAFVLSGVCLRLSRPRANAAPLRPTDWVARIMAVLIVGLGLLTLGEYAFGWNLGIDQMLFDDPLPSPATAAPGRMAPMTALNLTLLGAALLLIDIDTRGGKRPCNWLALAIAANSFVAILGHLYGVDALYRIAALTSMALHTAILFVVFSVALVCARPGGSFVRQIAGDTAGGLILRRLLPAAILIPPFVGWLRWQGEQAGYYSTAFGLAIFAASNVVIFAALAWWSARALQGIHEQRIAVSQTSAWQQAMLNSADFTMISTDAQGVIRTINAGALSLLGYAPAELIGATPAIIHDSAEVAARAQSLSRELGYTVEPGFEALVARARRGITDENDWTYIRKDGSRFPVRLSVTPLADANGTLAGFLGIGKDISAQKIAEESLLESEALTRAILAAAVDAIIIIDARGNIESQNAAAEKLFGYTATEMLGQNVRMLMPEPYKAEHDGYLKNYTTSGIKKIIGIGREVVGLRKNGETFPMELAVSEVQYGGRRLFTGIVRDITERKKAETQLVESEVRLRVLTDSLPALVAYFDHEGRYQFANAAAEQIFGVDTATIIGRTMREVRGEAVYAYLADKVARALRGEPVNFESPVRKGGRDFIYQSIYVPDVGADGGVRGFYAMGFDITDRRTAEKRLAESEARLQTITDNVPALISYIDREHRFRFNNSTYAQWLGRPLAEITGRRLDEVYDAAMYELFRPHLEKALTGTPATFEFASPALGRFIRGTYIPDVNAENEVLGVYGLINDISMQQEIEAKLRQLAQFDSLTGLANRSRFNDKLAEAIARSERSGVSLALIFLDLDRFKAINDTLGHQAGDLVLQEFAKRLSHCVRSTDTVARLAGDEFVIILESLKHPGDEGKVAAKIVAAMEAPFRIFNEQRAVSTSMGIAVQRPGETDGAALLQRADAALYKVKAAERGGFLVEV